MRPSYNCLVLASLLQWATARVSIEVPGYAKTVVGGQAKSLHTGRDYYFFHNLKYAQPPTNENRFLVAYSLNRFLVGL